MLSIGEKVIHCIRGAGIITEKKELQITGAPAPYFVIQLLGSRSTLMVPQDKAEQRLRPVSKRATLRRLLANHLAGKPNELPQDHKKRAKHIESELKSGETKKWAEVVRDLICREQENSLSSADRQLLDRALYLLAGELALSQGIDHEEAKNHLLSAARQEYDSQDPQVPPSEWQQTLGQRVKRSFTKSSTQAEIRAD